MNKYLSTKGLRCLCFALFLAFFAGFNLHAQDVGSATIDPETRMVSLNANAEFIPHYRIDISQVNFASQTIAEEFFAKLAGDLITVIVSFSENQLDLFLNSREKPEWGVTEWNALLAELQSEED